MQPASGQEPSSGPWGVLSALPDELGSLVTRATGSRSVQGLEVHEVPWGGQGLLATAAGVGRVAGAHGASVLLSRGARALIVVGLAGSLQSHLQVGSAFHVSRAIQAGLGVREGREVPSDPELLSWARLRAPGPVGDLISVERALRDPLRRWRLRRAYPAALAVDMETAGAFAVAVRAGCPICAVRVVSDGASLGALREFAQNREGLAGRAADLLFGASPGADETTPEPPSPQS